MWPCRRTVAATVAAPSTGIPAVRSTRAASVRLLPVVTRSSTITTVAALIGHRPSLHEYGSARYGIPHAEPTGSNAGHRPGRIKPALAYGRGCRRDGHQHDRCGTLLLGQQRVHAQCQPFSKDASQDQCLAFLVRIDHPAQQLVVRGGGNGQREPVRSRRWHGDERLPTAKIGTARRTESPPGLLATVAAGAEQQISRRGNPVTEAHRPSLPPMGRPIG